jgi:hypothetical protein
MGQGNLGRSSWDPLVLSLGEHPIGLNSCGVAPAREDDLDDLEDPVLVHLRIQ